MSCARLREQPWGLRHGSRSDGVMGCIRTEFREIILPFSNADLPQVPRQIFLHDTEALLSAIQCSQPTPLGQGSTDSDGPGRR